MEKRAYFIGVLSGCIFLLMVLWSLVQQKVREEYLQQQVLGSINAKDIYTFDVLPGGEWQQLSANEWQRRFEDYVDQHLLSSFYQTQNISEEADLKWASQFAGSDILYQDYKSRVLRLLRQRAVVRWQKKSSVGNEGREPARNALSKSEALPPPTLHR